MALFGREKKIKYLRKIPILQGCTRQQLVAVARISDITEVPAGTPLARAGDPGKEFFIILDGTARVQVPARKRSRLGPGDFFGEISLLDGEPRSATVVAETPLRLLVLNRPAFWALLTEVPQLSYKILVTLSRRVRQAEKSLRA
ncbi:MAG: cyclic nucleotide-binding domain-containing protein [Candidatus Rokubacteria bacterium]|nr:cyclic nucleotide-binding domain-containing protein [Candidatus Rokubacteria bacterium]